MKVVVTGRTGRTASKVFTRPERNAHQAVTPAADMGADMIAGVGLPKMLEAAEIEEDFEHSAHASRKCRGSNCTHCATCPVNRAATYADAPFLRPDEALAGLLAAERDPWEAVSDTGPLHFGVRLTDFLLLPDGKPIQDAVTLDKRFANVPPRRKN